MSILARLDEATVGYASRPRVVERATLHVDEGQTVAIVGPSGGGKTTLLKAMLGLVPPAEGTVTVLGSTWPARAERGRVGYIPQRLGLIRHASALHNAMLGGLARLPAWRSLLGAPTSSLIRDAKAALGEVGLHDHSSQPVKDLSGGQQRRVAVARALVQRPRLLLADEFLGELDVETARVVTGAVRRMQETTGMGMVMVEHNLDQALAIADRVYLLRDHHLRPFDAPGIADAEAARGP